jgi:hypothetical protein
MSHWERPGTYCCGGCGKEVLGCLVSAWPGDAASAPPGWRQRFVDGELEGGESRFIYACSAECEPHAEEKEEKER